nr:N-acetylglucosamine-6-phosphate deacetylase [uncultured Anaeromusa sp.]
MQAIVNSRLVTVDSILSQWALVFQNSRIVALTPQQNLPSDMPCIDAAGLYVSSGWIDAHTHGCGGCDVMDALPASLDTISLLLASQGVTSFLPTTMTMDWLRIEAALQCLNQASWPGAHSLGCHLEGPFLSAVRQGAQAPQHLRPFDFSLLAPYLTQLRLITIAPEETGGLEFISRCCDAGLTVSIGHSNATYEEACQAFAAGASHLTHTFNALSPLHHRQPGAIGAALDLEHVFCEVIADNLHVHPAMQRLLLRQKGVDRLLLVSDSMRAALLGEGHYDLGGQAVTVSDGAARLENGALAGSITSLPQELQKFQATTSLSLPALLRTITSTAAQSVGVFASKGSLTPGKDADFVLFHDDFTVEATYVAGRSVFQRTPVAAHRSLKKL